MDILVKVSSTTSIGLFSSQFFLPVNKLLPTTRLALLGWRKSICKIAQRPPGIHLPFQRWRNSGWTTYHCVHKGNPLGANTVDTNEHNWGAYDPPPPKYEKGKQVWKVLPQRKQIVQTHYEGLFEVVIVDEAHTVKNWSTRIWKFEKDFLQGWVRGWKFSAKWPAWRREIFGKLADIKVILS